MMVMLVKAAAKTLALFLCLSLAAAAVGGLPQMAPPLPLMGAEAPFTSTSGGRFPLTLSHRRGHSGTALAGVLILALECAARTFGRCAAQSAAGAVKAARKISALAGGGLGDGDRFGSSVASVGDLDGDAVTDICVGARGDDDGANGTLTCPCLRGSVFVLFLNANGTVKGSQKISMTAGGLAQSGVSLDDGDYFGASVASVGDVDGDAVPDIAVGAPNDDDGDCRVRPTGSICEQGAVYILFLNSNGTVKGSQKISARQGNLSSVGVSLLPSDQFGYSVASLGDFDGDSVNDICVGAPGDQDCCFGSDRSRRSSEFYRDLPTETYGAVYVLFLNSDGTVGDVQKISQLAGGGLELTPFGRFGSAVTALGDLDGDSVLDICVGAPDDDDSGAAYILFLNGDGSLKMSQKISSTEGGLSANGVTLESGDRFGISVASLGDFDGDAVNDICVGAPEYSSTNGAVYMLSLNADGTVKALQKIPSTVAGYTAGPGIPGSFDEFGKSIAFLGDIDGDNVTDICVGNEKDSDPGGPYERGAVFMLYLNGTSLTSGSPTTASATTNAGLAGSPTTASATTNAGLAGSPTTASLTSLNSTSGTSPTTTLNASSSPPSSATVTTMMSGVTTTTTTTTTAAKGQETSESSESVDSTILIIVLVLCALLLLCAVVAAITYFRVKRSSERSDGTLQDVELPDYDILRNNSPSKSNAESHNSMTRADELDVEITREVGKGAFGAVFLGSWSGQDVAIKCVQSGDASELFAELEILEKLNHPRIVRFFGVAEVEENPAIVMEWCAHGSLDELLKARQDFGPSHFLRFCLQISQGLAFLTSKGILHRDLACRNVLADEKDNVKITDFGLSRNADVAGQYLVTSAVPIRWTAIEVLHDRAASSKSDVYSLGIVFVEVYSRAEQPYADLVSGAEVIVAVLGGRRPRRPRSMPGEVYGLAAECWVASPDERPDASTVVERLTGMSSLLLEEGGLPATDSDAIATNADEGVVDEEGHYDKMSNGTPTTATPRDLSDFGVTPKTAEGAVDGEGHYGKMSNGTTTQGSQTSGSSAAATPRDLTDSDST